MSPIVELVIRLAGIISFIWFVSYWANLFSTRIEPSLRRMVSQRLGIEILRRQKGPSYHWATPDERPKSRVLVFVWCASLFLIIGSGPMLMALVVLGFLSITLIG
jgi:hypothetical protein